MPWKIYDTPVDAISWYNTHVSKRGGVLERGLMLKLRYSYLHNGEFHEQVFVVGDVGLSGKGGNFDMGFPDSIFDRGYFGPFMPSKKLPYIVHVIAENREVIELIKLAHEDMEPQKGRLDSEEVQKWQKMMRYDPETGAHLNPRTGEIE